MAWKKVELGNTWDFEKNPVIDGVYLSKEENVGPNNSKIYRIEVTETKETVSVWGSTALDSQMENVKTGSRIKIEYKGLAPSPKRPGKSYKNFVVEVWEE